VTIDAGQSDLRRRWDRYWLRLHARLDGDTADRVLPWVNATIVSLVQLALTAATIRSSTAGGGLAPWLQAAWARTGEGVVHPVGGLDPATASASLVGEMVLHLSRFFPAAAVFAVVQSVAIGAAVVPLWRLARERAGLRVGATSAVIAAYALAPTVHQAGLTPFHPELVALPFLLVAWLQASRGAWVKYGLAVLAVLACRGDLGITVAAMGLLVAAQHHRRNGTVTAMVGVAWSAVALALVEADQPSGQLTPAGEFVSRAVGPLAAVEQVATNPLGELGAVLSQPSVEFLVVVLAPLLFLPLMSFRRFAPSLPGLTLAMVADRAVARAAGAGVLDLAPTAAHITPSMAFTFVALVFALERIGQRSVVRVNVDRRLLGALMCGSILFFLVESPSAPYHRPWDWGGRGSQLQVLERTSDAVPGAASLAASPSATALVAERSVLVELPPDPVDLTTKLLNGLAARVEWVLLDTSGTDPDSGDPVWQPDDVESILESLERAGFETQERERGIVLLRHR
jgi:hypothetical protein